MKKIIYWLIIGSLALSSVSCCLFLRPTIPISSKKRTAELLSIHTSICPRIPFDMNKDKIVFFSDLHRGMGSKDIFKYNKKLFVKILKHYNRLGYTLVYVGDIEEGWGFQSDNTPLILEDHSEELDVEMEFLKDNRYYRVYGNHDDFYRGHYFKFKNHSARVYPAIIFEDKEKDFTILITHGCQGQGLHDAGDELASFGVYVKYNWLAEILLKNVKSEKKLVQIMEERKKKYKSHEKKIVDWVKNDGHGNKRFDILIAGHTHIPVFESLPVEESFALIKKDIDEEKYIFFNDVFKGQEENTSLMPPGSIKQKMKKTLDQNFTIAKRQRAAAARSKQEGEESIPLQDGFYFNTGCAFHSEIPCIEICEGKISLKFIKDIKDQELDARVFTKTNKVTNRKEDKYKKSLADFKKK